jgi:hypothetical protein
VTISKNKISGTEIFAYLVIISVFCITLIFPLIFNYTDPFSAPTAAYANLKLENNGGEIVFNSTTILPYNFWKDAINYESNYPAPYLLILIFMIISGIPYNYTMFIPLAGIANIILFVLARYILRGNTSKSCAILFSALYYAFVTILSIDAVGVGRAALGVTFSAYFVFCYVKFLQGWANNKPERSWAILSLLLALVMGYTYYTGTLMIIAVAALLMITFAISSKLKMSVFHAFSIIVLTVFLFINNPIINNIISGVGLTSYIVNFQEYAGYLLEKFGIHVWNGAQAAMLQAGFVNIDFISNIGRSVANVIQYSAIISVIAIVICKLRNIHIPNVVWLLSLIALYSGLAEFFSYLAVGPSSSFRFIIKFGLIATLFIIGHFLNKYNSSHPKKVKIFTLLTVLLISSGCLGLLGYYWQYGAMSGKPFVYQEVKPLADFMCEHSSNAEPITVTGDMYYMTNIFFITSIHNQINNVIPEPLLNDSIMLHECWESGKINDFLTRINNRGIEYLLLAKDTRPIWGDTWGWSVDPPEIDKLYSMPVNVVYSDSNLILFGTQT